MPRLTIELTKMQISFIKRNWDKMSNGAMAKKFNIKFTTFSIKLHDLGLYRMHFEYWTEEQIQFLKDNYKEIGDKELAILFNGLWDKEKRWSWKHMEKKRLYLELKRTPEQIAKIKIRNTKRGCFLGTTTWKTRGESPDGTIRQWSHSWDTNNGRVTSPFLAIKIKGKYVHYARWLYEDTYGPMQEGYVVGFKDRNNLNVVPENLESISRAEHARRNASNLKYPDELRETIKLLKEINHTIKIKQDGNNQQRPNRRTA